MPPTSEAVIVALGLHAHEKKARHDHSASSRPLVNGKRKDGKRDFENVAAPRQKKRFFLRYCKHSYLTEYQPNKIQENLTVALTRTLHYLVLCEKPAQIELQSPEEDRKRRDRHNLEILCGVSRKLSACFKTSSCMVQRPVLKAVSVVSETPFAEKLLSSVL